MTGTGLVISAKRMQWIVEELGAERYFGPGYRVRVEFDHPTAPGVRCQFDARQVYFVRHGAGLLDADHWESSYLLPTRVDTYDANNTWVIDVRFTGPGSRDPEVRYQARRELWEFAAG